MMLGMVVNGGFGAFMSTLLITSNRTRPTSNSSSTYKFTFGILKSLLGGWGATLIYAARELTARDVLIGYHNPSQLLTTEIHARTFSAYSRSCWTRHTSDIKYPESPSSIQCRGTSKPQPEEWLFISAEQNRQQGLSAL